VNPAASVGHGAVVNTGSIVEHDCRLGDFVFLSPGAVLGGEAVLGASCHVGLGAVVLPRRRVGAGSRVGAGAAVVHDVPDGETWVGVPAASLPRR
jgi:acetyltransferase-like isoleucine patch superfamily enzyme